MPKKERSIVTKGTLTERAYHAIKGAILRGEIEEGTFLSEAEIRRRYGIGRTPFREACNRLHNEQILEAVPHRGYLVPELSYRTVRDMFETRLILEGTIAAIAAVRAEPEQLKELEAVEVELESSGNSKNDYEKLIRANTEFHLILARMTQNRELLELARRVLQRTERLSYIDVRRSGFQRAQIRTLHRPIAEAIRKRDPVAARKAVLDDIAQGQINIASGDQRESDWITGHASLEQTTP
jgi:GntR family transcriptional regulator, rspAB operon transcriptional repressor